MLGGPELEFRGAHHTAALSLGEGGAELAARLALKRLSQSLLLTLVLSLCCALHLWRKAGCVNDHRVL